MSHNQRHRMQEHRISNPALAEQCREMTHRAVEQSPLIVVLGAFGLGLGVGAAIGRLLSRAATTCEPSTTERLRRQVTDSIDRLRSHVAALGSFR
jgi:hypothetical protein